MGAGMVRSMMTAATASIWIVLLARAQADDGLSFETPAGWGRQEDAARKRVVLVPAGVPPGQGCAVVIFPPERYDGTAEALQGRLVALSSQGGEVQGQAQAGTIGGFRYSAFVWKTPPGPLQWVAVHSAQWEGRMQAVLFFADSQDLFTLHGKAVVAMLAKVAVPGAGPAPAVPPASSTPAPAAGAAP